MFTPCYIFFFRVYSSFRMTHGSLFTGIGGFDLGFERAGFRTLWQVEIEKFPRRVLRTHFPRAKRFRDVRRCGARNLAPVDCITAGVPCQDVSVAGKRAGLAGKRTGLFYEFARILRELRPAWFVFENVPGLLSSNSGRDFGEILRVLMVECGYGVAWRVLDSRYFGVAQRRRRVFIVGSLGTNRAHKVLFEPEGGAWNPAPSSEAGKDVAYALAASVRGTGGNGDDMLNEELFWSKVDRSGGENSCWTWTGGTKDKAGYGRFGTGSRTDESTRMRFAHRIAYELLIGPLPEGTELDHTCRNHGCANPLHLEPVSHRENVIRGEGPPALNARKTECISGHRFTEGNTYFWRGKRLCRACRKEADGRRQRNRRSEPGSESGPGVAYTLGASVRKSGDGHGNAWNSNYVASGLRASDGHHGRSSPRGDGSDNLVASPLKSSSDHRISAEDAAGSHLVAATLSAASGAKQPGGRRREDDTNIVTALRHLGRGGPDDNEAQRGHIIAFDTYNQAAGELPHPIRSGGGPEGIPAVACAPSDANRGGSFAGLPEGMDSARYRALGNAVTVQVAFWLARRIMMAERYRYARL